MFPYWILFLLVASGATLERVRPHTLHRYQLPLLFALVGITLMIGMRFQVGGDWQTYQLMYDYTARRSLGVALDRGDPGYQGLSWLFGQAGMAMWTLNLACAAMFTWGLVQLARNQPTPWLAILVAVPYLIVVVAMGYTRQAAAIGLIMAGLAAVERGAGVFRFAGYVLVAALFHKTAIVVLPVVMFASSRNPLVSIVAGVMLTVGMYTAFLADSMDTFVANYIEADYQSQGATIRVAMNLVPALLMLWRGRDLQLGDYQYRLWRLMAFVALALVPALVLSPSSTAVDRLALYVLPIQVVVLPRLVLLFRNSLVGKAAVMAYAAAVLFVWLTFAEHSRAWIPYQLYPVNETVRIGSGIER